VINGGIIPPLLQLLQTAEFDIKKEAAWAISNATSGGSHDQIKYVLNVLPCFSYCLQRNFYTLYF
jgi:hypothetical protein